MGSMPPYSKLPLQGVARVELVDVLSPQTKKIGKVDDPISVGDYRTRALLNANVGSLY